MDIVWMKPVNEGYGRFTILFMQVLLWSAFYFLLLLYTTHKFANGAFGVANATIATSFYIISAYANALWLIPKFFRKGRLKFYFPLALLFLIGLVLVRVFTEFKILKPLHPNFYGLQYAHFAFDSITILVAFLFGALLKIALNHLSLLKQKEQILSRQAATELNLLKAQVQPHFLFNTLNNIYSLSKAGSNKTPDMIAKLSDLMRYFIDDSPKDKVPLEVELEFINNYLELEQIRMLHPVRIHMNVQGDSSTTKIPPMLLMPLIENVFKHGIDKTEEVNELKADLRLSEVYLEYRVENLLHQNNGCRTSKGVGLTNLQKRLELLFPGNYELRTSKNGIHFTAYLKIPV